MKVVVVRRCVKVAKALDSWAVDHLNREFESLSQMKLAICLLLMKRII